MYVNHNLMASNVARNLNDHYSQLAASTQRLSSGLRINGASDDAAGVAIRELQRADISALHQGVRNANDAISMLQVADGALAIIDEKLIRMKELAEQAATGTYDSTQRLMIDSEFQAMASEIDRIANATDFNGIKLLDGSLAGEHNGNGLTAIGKMKIHFGSGNDSAEDYYYVEIGDCSTKGLGITKEVKIDNLSSSTTFSKLPSALQWINSATIDYENGHISFDVTDRIGGENASSFMSGIDFYKLPIGLSNINITSIGAVEHPNHRPHASLFTNYGMQVKGPTLDDRYETFLTSASAHVFISGFPWWNNLTADQVISKGKSEGVFLDNANYRNYSIAAPYSWDLGDNATLYTSYFDEIGSGLDVNYGVQKYESLRITNIVEESEEMVFFIGGHENDKDCNRYNLTIEADITPQFIKELTAYADEDIDKLTIETQQKAQEALVTIDEAISTKDKIRAHLGALQNRFENTVSNLTIQAENLQAAESRISDVDVATEMTNFVRNQILTQSAVAMLSQANSMDNVRYFSHI